MKRFQEFYMNRAFEIAKQVDPHKTAPNPRVGCIVVRNGEIITEGVHEQFGKAHAEVNACQNISDLSECEIYITLEPCHIFPGKNTPSCTDLLLSKNPQKIYIGALDPTFQGKNIELIQSKGIEVEVLDFEKRNKELNLFFPRKKRPYICLKLAQTLDGKINLDTSSYSEGKSYITNELSRKKVHELRSKYSAILTTTETVLKDNPLLDVRLEENPRNQREDAKSETIRSSSFIPEPYRGSNPMVFIFGNRELPENLRIFSIPDRKVVQIPRKQLKNTLGELWSIHKIDSVVTEGGSWLVSELLKNDLVDEIQLFIAPKISGKGKQGFQIEKFLGNFELTQIKDLNGDIYLRFIKR